MTNGTQAPEVTPVSEAAPLLDMAESLLDVETWLESTLMLLDASVDGAEGVELATDESSEVVVLLILNDELSPIVLVAACDSTLDVLSSIVVLVDVSELDVGGTSVRSHATSVAAIELTNQAKQREVCTQNPNEGDASPHPPK